MGSSADHSVLDSDCPVGRRSYLARLFSNQSRDLSRTAVTTIGGPRVGVPTEPQGRSGPRGGGCVVSLPSTNLECFKCAAARRDSNCVSGVCRINSGPSLAARPRWFQAAGATERRVRRRCGRRGACLKSGLGWLATKSVVLMEPSFGIGWASPLACNGLDIGTAEIDLDWCGDEEGRVAESWRREQLSRENTPGVRGQEELADERIHLLLLGILISRDRNRGGTAAWDTGILCKVPPIRANAVARIGHVLGRELFLPGGLSPGLRISPLFLAQDQLYFAME